MTSLFKTPKISAPVPLPSMPAPIPLADDPQARIARRKRIDKQATTGGRQSTILEGSAGRDYTARTLGSGSAS